jgi:hypothetical protein
MIPSSEARNNHDNVLSSTSGRARPATEYHLYVKTALFGTATTAVKAKDELGTLGVDGLWPRLNPRALWIGDIRPMQSSSERPAPKQALNNVMSCVG